MKAYNELRIETRDPVRVAYKHFRTDWKFMRQHGWGRAAYVARYGTTQSPKLGDGGPLIWRADLFNHAKLRQEFLRAFSDHATVPVRRNPLYRVWAFLMSDHEQKRFARLMDEAKAEKTPKGKALNEFAASYA